jgi:hypothetical protein
VDIKATGVESAFNKEFKQMEDNLAEIRQIVRNANISTIVLKGNLIGD